MPSRELHALARRPWRAAYAGSVPAVVHTIADVRAAVAAARERGRRITLTPTMGALHAGHLSHLDAARAAAPGAFTVVSVFVNPLQFGKGEDLDRYPRDLDADVAALDRAAADLVFAPSVEEMYPDGGVQVSVNAGPVATRFEGASRPGHFDGALTVVAKLLDIVGPDLATFGRKDAQQLFLVERMVRDLDLPVEILPVEIVREDDGLAMSSRNRFLGAGERRAARALSRALEAAESAAERGIDAVLAAAQSVTMGEDEIEVDYFAVVNPSTFAPVEDAYRGPIIALIAAKVGETRLIDNARFRLG